VFIAMPTIAAAGQIEGGRSAREGQFRPARV
jgi:hypothetical protein